MGHGDLIPLFWLFISIFLMQMLLSRMKGAQIPTILGYLILGILLSYYGRGLFHQEEMNWLDNLSEFGLYYLMFLSGMEIDFNILRYQKGAKLRQNPLVIGFLVFAGSALLAFLLGTRINQIDSSTQPWMIMLILLTTSLGIVMPVLKETRIIKSQYGQLLLTSAILADLITMIILSIIGGSYQSGFTWRQASVGLLLPLSVILYQAIFRLKRTSFWHKEIRKNSVVRLQGLLAVLGLYGIITDMTGSEAILGSFLAGLLLASFHLHDHHPFKEQLEVLGYGLIIPIFFVMVGFRFNLTEFLRSPQALGWVPLLLSTAYIVKVLPMMCLGPILGMRRALAGGFLLSSRMTLIVVAASIGMRLGIINRGIQDAVIVVAIITSLLSPMIFSMSIKSPS
ncbi:cation:proton antiporter [Paenibacillus filicis]|uniref:Cation:proton antiporter n=1 Tax=Paenibacillus gyeongsangnamensis TaxID=3388067 RepID=A0ABT4QJX8_9BACL|nr:cation:proton antiporter [Paenibacillus filicis]MCZ8517189.1 cation:proton antiporter [Paenibacillus filicis]